MWSYLVKRLIQAAFTAVFVSLIVFSLARLTGDPTLLLLPTESTQEDREFLKRQLGLDKPLHQQYLNFIDRIFRGDLGTSFRYKAPALGIVLERFPATLELTFAAMTLATIIALPLGIAAAVQKDRWIDSFVRSMATLGQATPTFWLGLVLMMIFAVHLGWLPTSGRRSAAHLVLPALTLGMYSAGAIARLTRSTMIDALKSDFARFERLSGVSEWRVVLRHALKNSAIPIVTYMALQFGVLLSGAVVTETIFAWPGLGMLVVDAINVRDYPVVQTAVLLTALLILFVNFLVDIFYGVIDPRVRT
jgi:peptide/nickel transport system permease protein